MFTKIDKSHPKKGTQKKNYPTDNRNLHTLLRKSKYKFRCNLRNNTHCSDIPFFVQFYCVHKGISSQWCIYAWNRIFVLIGWIDGCVFFVFFRTNVKIQHRNKDQRQLPVRCELKQRSHNFRQYCDPYWVIQNKRNQRTNSKSNTQHIVD